MVCELRSGFCIEEDAESLYRLQQHSDVVMQSPGSHAVVAVISSTLPLTYREYDIMFAAAVEGSQTVNGFTV